MTGQVMRWISGSAHCKEETMPYIAIKSFPKDDETKKKVVDKINEIFLRYWGCPPPMMAVWEPWCTCTN